MASSSFSDAEGVMWRVQEEYMRGKRNMGSSVAKVREWLIFIS
jgi:hypothetical protein